MICFAPFVGITIDPSGEITLCCNEEGRGVLGAKISDVDDLNDFFRGERYQVFRDAMREKGWLEMDACVNCARQHHAGRWTNAQYYDAFNGKTPDEYENDLYIRFLELTPSNICNQSCVMCASYFSTTRAKVEKQIWGKAGHDLMKITDEDVEKIVKITPGLEKLMLKGGEPFADRANLKILKSLIGVNKKCDVHIVSNMHAIPDEFMDVLSDLSDQGNHLRISASIDGTHDLYHWIRGTEFKPTVRTIRDFIVATNTYVDINTTVSLYNFLDLAQIEYYFTNNDFNNKIGRFSFRNHVVAPWYAAPVILPQEVLDNEAYHPDVSGLQHKKYEMGYILDYIRKMDDVRGIRLFDIQPRLEDLLNNGYQESRN